MQVFCIAPAGFAANSYLITQDGRSAVAVDPAQPRILGEAKRCGLNVTHVLLTHGHFDHTGGCAALQQAGARVGCLVQERALALGQDSLAFGMGGRRAGEFPDFTIDFTFRDGEALSLCGIDFLVLATPGHTAGSACFLAEDCLFTGDTLFAGGVGRTDLPTGSAAALMRSLARLAALAGDLRVLPGHGEESTLLQERRYNPFFR